MQHVKVGATIKSFLRATSGATAIEYALIAGGISLMVIAGATLVGTGLDGIFNSAASGF